MDRDGVKGARVRQASDGQKGGHTNALPAATRVSEFELERVLGEGGFSFVYLAFDHTLERHVAIKEYLPGAYAIRCDDGTVAPKSGERQATFEAGLRSFIDEARLLAKFEHPALVKVLRFWEANGTAYMAMPHYQGQTLREIVKTDPGFATEARLKALISPLLDAVALLHAQKCYHRDIAPDNIIVQPDGAPVLLDFGAARRIIGDMTHALTVILKPGYAPIEQYADEGGPAQGPWTDVYAFAAVLYCAITGKAPLAAVARAYNDALVPLQRNPPAGYSSQFLRAIDAALAVRPEDRPQSIAAFRDSLGLNTEKEYERTRVIPGQQSPSALRSPSQDPEFQSQPRPTETASKTPTPRIRGRPAMLAGAIAAAVLVSLGLLVYFTMIVDRSDTKPGPDAAATTPPLAPAVPTAPDPRAEVGSTLLALDCAHASFELGGGGSLIVNGHVQDAGQLTELERQLRGIAGVKDLKTNLAFVPRPFCEVTSLVEGLRNSEGGKLEVRVIRPKPPLRVGQQPVYLDVVGPDFAANIAVDVWSVAEKKPIRLEVAHLLPHTGYSLSDQFKVNERKTINRFFDGKGGEKPMEIRVNPPAGRLLFTAIASDSPLVSRNRALTGDPSQYIASLRADANARGSNARVATWYGFVEVLP